MDKKRLKVGIIGCGGIANGKHMPSIKAVNMADMMHVPVLGIVENMAYYTCPDCGKQHAIFGDSHIEAIAAKHGIPNTAKLPIDPAIAAACDAGKIEDVQGDWLSSLADAIEGK